MNCPAEELRGSKLETLEKHNKEAGDLSWFRQDVLFIPAAELLGISGLFYKNIYLVVSYSLPYIHVRDGVLRRGG